MPENSPTEVAKPINKYRKGRRLEYRTMRRLEAEGYTCTRAASSKGVFDVIALHPQLGLVRAIQVKANRAPSGIELETLHQQKSPAYSVEIWRWRDRARDPEVTIL